MRRMPFVLVFVGWTLAVWATRLNNIWSDDGLTTSEQVGRSALAASFTVAALVVLMAARRPGSPATVRTVAVLAAWTTAVWAVRGVGILVGDWSGAFKAVHTGLAVVSVALAVLALREARRAGAGSRRTTADAVSVPG